MATAAAAAVQRAIPQLEEVVYRAIKTRDFTGPFDLSPNEIVRLMKEGKGFSFVDKVLKIAVANNYKEEEIYNAYVAACASASAVLGRSAIKKIAQLGVTPGSQAYVSLASAMGRENPNWSLIVEYLRVRGLLGPKEWAQLLADATPTESLKLFSMMKEEHKIKPSREIFHGLIESHGRKREGMMTLGSYPPKGIFDEMRRMGIEPTAETYELLTVLRDDVDTAVCKKMYYGAKKRGITPTISTYAHWISRMASERDWEWCNDLWKEIEVRESEFTRDNFTNLLRAFSASPNSDITIKILDRVVKNKLLDGTKGYNYILLSLAKLGDAQGCRKYFAMMENAKYTPTSETFEYLIQAHLASKEYTKIVQYEKDASMRFAVVFTRNTWRYLLAAYAAANDTRNIDRVLRQMVAENEEVDEQDFAIMFAYAPNSSLVRRLHTDIRTKIPAYDVQATAAQVFHAYVRVKDEKSAMEVFNNLMTQETRAAHGAYDAVLRAVCAAGSAEVIVNSLLHDAKKQNIRLEKETYDGLVQFYNKHGAQPRVLALADEMANLGYQMSESTSNVVVTAQKGGSLLDTVLEEVESEEEVPVVESVNQKTKVKKT